METLYEVATEILLACEKSPHLMLPNNLIPRLREALKRDHYRYPGERPVPNATRLPQD